LFIKDWRLNEKIFNADVWIFFFLTLASALDSQLIIPCGLGDTQISHPCFPSNLNLFYFSREFISPIVSLLGPLDNTEDTDGWVTFSWSVSDSSRISRCSLYFDNLLEEVDTSITKDIEQSLTIHDIPVKDNLAWFIECIDMWGNSGNSTTFHLDTLLGHGTLPGGGGGTGEFDPKSLGIVNVSSLLCDLTYNSSLKNQSKYVDIDKIRKIYLNITNQTVTWTEVRIYIDNWEKLCGIEDEEKPKPLVIVGDGKINIWLIVIITFLIILIIFLLYSGKRWKYKVVRAWSKWFEKESEIEEVLGG